MDVVIFLPAFNNYSSYEVKCENYDYLKKLQNKASLPLKADYSSEKAKY